MPVLEAVAQLAGGPAGEWLMPLLRRYAPTWLAQMPWLVSDADLEALCGRTEGAGPERMPRELAAAVERLPGDGTLVLVLEDLHWSNPSTVDLISLLAEGRHSARLLVVGTYRPFDAAAREHPLRTRLHRIRLRRGATEISLPGLCESEVEDYLAARFSGGAPPVGLASLLLRRSDGNPLFLVEILDHLVARGWLVKMEAGCTLTVDLDRIGRTVPDSLQEMIEAEIEGLHPGEVRHLEVASALGVEFSARAAAAASEDAEGGEAIYERLALQGRFLRRLGHERWPDGTRSRRFVFVHSLHQEHIYDRIPAARRRRTHLRIGESLEGAMGSRARDIAPVLALHFERAGEPGRALYYWKAAAKLRRRGPPTPRRSDT